MYTHITQATTNVLPKSSIPEHPQAAPHCQNSPFLAARTAARTWQFWQPKQYPEQYPELPSSGRKNQPELARKCTELARIGQFWLKKPARTGQKVHSRHGHSSARTELFWQQKVSSQVPAYASVTVNSRPQSVLTGMSENMLPKLYIEHSKFNLYGQNN